MCCRDVSRSRLVTVLVQVVGWLETQISDIFLISERSKAKHQRLLFSGKDFNSVKKESEQTVSIMLVKGITDVKSYFKGNGIIFRHVEARLWESRTFSRYLEDWANFLHLIFLSYQSAGEHAGLENIGSLQDISELRVLSHIIIAMLIDDYFNRLIGINLINCASPAFLTQLNLNASLHNVLFRNNIVCILKKTEQKNKRRLKLKIQKYFEVLFKKKKRCFKIQIKFQISKY